MNQKEFFPAVESRINVLTTWIIYGLLYGLLLFCFIIFGVLPAYGIYTKGGKGITTPAVICFLILAFVWAPAVWFYFIKRKRTARKITVNNMGLFYYNARHKAVTQVLYTDLSPSGRDFDITTTDRSSKGLFPLLEFYVQSEKEGTKVIRIEMSLPVHVVSNRLHLYAHFLKGISVFRPDLRIDQKVFQDYSIDKETWQVVDKSSTSFLLLIFLAVFLTAGLLIGLVMIFT